MKECNRTGEAPEHSNGCSGLGNTRDHFTPKCIAKLMGWSNKMINCYENIQYLSEACHVEKDRTTPKRLELLRRQLEGEMIAFGQHQIEMLIK